MAYAETSHLRGAAGKVASYWGDDTHPGEADLETFLDDGSALVDVALSAKGVGVPVSDANAVAALRPVVVDYALVRALDATFGGASPAEEVAALRQGASDRWAAWLASIADGSNALVDILLSGAGAPLATSLWQEEPDYGQPGAARPPEDDNYRLAPYTARGDVF